MDSTRILKRNSMGFYRCSLRILLWNSMGFYRGSLIDKEFYKDSKGFRWKSLDGSYGLGHPLNSIKILQEF